MKGRISRIALAVVAVALSATVAPAGKPDLDIALSLQTAIQDLAAQVGPAVVNIETVRTQPRPSTRFRWRMPQPDRLPPELREYFEKFRDFEGPEGRELPPSETKANGSGVIISADGYILTALRHLVGTDIPIIAQLDIHSNMSDAMIEQADVLIGR
ncbi:MAG: M81 family metallopeptidase, partial [Phycisphaerae bacterium]|nr:M81 family metallopeptidase [Phycisphaerae bacterium]